MTEVPCPSMQAESSLSRLASDSRGAESEPSTLTQGVASTSAVQKAADSPQAEQVSVKQTFLGFHRTAHDLPVHHCYWQSFHKAYSLDVSFLSATFLYYYRNDQLLIIY